MSAYYIVREGKHYEVSKEQYEKVKKELLPYDHFEPECKDSYFSICSVGRSSEVIHIRY